MMRHVVSLQTTTYLFMIFLWVASSFQIHHSSSPNRPSLSLFVQQQRDGTTDFSRAKKELSSSSLHMTATESGDDDDDDDVLEEKNDFPTTATTRISIDVTLIPSIPPSKGGRFSIMLDGECILDRATEEGRLLPKVEEIKQLIRDKIIHEIDSLGHSDDVVVPMEQQREEDEEEDDDDDLDDDDAAEQRMYFGVF